MDKVELKPCAHCEGAAELQSSKGPTGELYQWVQCVACEAMSACVDTRSMQPEEAHPVDLWNARPATTIETLQAQLAARDAEIGRLREALAAKPWPPSDAELREMLAVIVGAWWSQSTANVIRTRRLTVEDVKGTYAIRDVLAPYIARAALGQGEG